MQENVYFEGGNFKNLQHLRGHIPPQTPPCVAQVRRNQCFALIVHQAVFPLRFLSLSQFYQIWQKWRVSCTKIISFG